MSETGRIAFTVPLVPPGMNHYVKHTRRGKHYVTAEALAYKEAVGYILRGRSCAGRAFSVEMRIVLGKGQKGDVDGFPKMVLDGLAASGAFADLKGRRLSDAHVRQMLVVLDCDERPTQGRTEIVVEAL